MTDLEIESSIKLDNIIDVAKKINLANNDLELYGNYKAKINNAKGNKNGKLVLVTSINPTPYGEGKTTISIGINDALNKLGYSSLAVLREPSLGPVFGIKGGATGGGLSQISPSIDINLHFTGDFHAITSANNLIASVIDNHIYFGNQLGIDRVTFNRCLDLNDRALRNVTTTREEHFDITAASEIMAILCLANDLEDLKTRISNIIVGYTKDNNPIYVKDLKCTDAVTILLKDTIKPNLVQSLEHNPVIVHGGPFANIAHGCNSLIATKTALSLADYVITEAGFGSDCGAEKFFDIKCRNNIKPSCVVLNFTLKALKHNGYCPKEDILKENIDYINKGFSNLEVHIENIKKFTNNIVIVLNKFNTDTDNEINYVKELLNKMGYSLYINESYTKGSEGSIEIAKAIINTCDNPTYFNYLYDLNENVIDKIIKVCKEIYHANNITFTSNALKEIENINKLGYSNYPICIAKTQYSISNDETKLGYPKNYDIEIDKISLKNGAKFIVVYLGKILTMPGLSKEPNLTRMYIDNNKIEGVM